MENSNKQKADQVRIIGFTARREKKICEPLDRIGNQSHCISLIHYEGLFSRYARMLVAGQRAIRQYQPDILLVDGADLIGFFTILLGFWFKIPVIVRQGGDPWQTRKEKLQEARQDGQYLVYIQFFLLSILNQITYSTADGFFVVSTELKSIFAVKTPCPRSRIKVVPVSLGTNTLKNIDETKEQSLDFQNIILTVTNLRYRGKFEGVCDAIQEIKTILSNRPNTAYIIAGSGRYYGPLVEYINKTVHEESVKDRILTVGFVDAVDRLYNAANVFVYISYNDGYPNVILEAQAASQPVIANADHGMVDQIDDGNTGLLIDPTNRGELQKSVEYLLDNPNIRQKLGQNATEKVQTKNSVDSIAKRMQEAAKDIYVQSR